VSNVCRNDAERDALVVQWFGLVPWTMNRLRHHAAVRRNWQDCRAEGFFALLRAATQWDESQGVKFNSYAVVCIRRAIMKLAITSTRQAPVLFSQLCDDDDDRAFDPADARNAADLDQYENLDHLAAALARLRLRHQQVLVMRFGLDGQEYRTLVEIGDAFSLTAERVRQLEKAAKGHLAVELSRQRARCVPQATPPPPVPQTESPPPACGSLCVPLPTLKPRTQHRKMRRRERLCRECHEPYSIRAGRGLCRPCWNDPAIRAKYPPLAEFGGGGAAEFATTKAVDGYGDRQE
jgi:RNA polymerase sigma factor (sigma-70 family)